MEPYYNSEDLSKFEEIGKEAPELAKKFFEYYGAVLAEGELSEREKALIALAVAHAIQCPYCIDAYTQACLEIQDRRCRSIHSCCRSRRGLHHLYR